jgi:signal transduction histidine kinase
LNNVFKHARASTVSVRLKICPDGFEIGIEDDGRGFGDEPRQVRPGSGNGMGNMRERMKQVGGEFEIQSTTGRGTSVRLRLRGIKIPAQ